MKVLREAGIRLADPSRFTIEQIEALAEVAGTFTVITSPTPEGRRS